MRIAWIGVRVIVGRDSWSMRVNEVCLGGL